MPLAHVNGIDIAYEEAGEGFPLIWCHEFAGSMESWDAQVNYFARRYRVITYNARGYPPTEVPEDPEAYSQDNAVEDLYGLLRYLDIDQAHVGGLSMGGSTTLHFGIRHPGMARSLIIAAAGSGSTNPEEFRGNSYELANRLDQEGSEGFADYAIGPARVQLKRKDPRGYERFADLLLGHSPLGSALTMRGVQAGRPPIFVWEREMQELRVPSLVLVGDEDEPCIEPSLFMKRLIPSSGLAMFPQSGHCINLEEPAMFNQIVAEFLAAVEAGKWDDRG
ncbi:MAG TPA: alpha/beta hydrolase [Dehalococcoidia bacterium]|nr:alpha/beta hydrolase [Dehalococcoidia bacterium]